MVRKIYPVSERFYKSPKFAENVATLPINIYEIISRLKSARYRDVNNSIEKKKITILITQTIGIGPNERSEIEIRRKTTMGCRW